MLLTTLIIAMAPVQQVGEFPGLTAMSLEVRDAGEDAPIDTSLSFDMNDLVSRSKSSSSSPHSKIAYGQGSIDPQNIHMQGLMALFAIIGAAFVLGAIWFFFWAKNGGFIWRKGDWDDYKSTVLRRKGPDGRTLSNATKSTKLGGGSVVGRGYSDDGYTYTDYDTYTETATTMTDEKPKKKRNLKQTAKQKLLRRRRDERWEGEADADVRAYREEKPARIGGMNREADGTYHGSDYDSSAPPTRYNESEMSEVRDYAYEQPRRSRRREPSGFSFTAGSDDVLSRTTEEHRAPARRQNRRRERDRRRSVAPAPAPAPASSSAPSSRTSSPRKKDRRSVPGGFTEPLDFSSSGTRSEYQYSNVDTEDSGTKSYHHPIPGLTKGYRRDRRDGRSSRRRRDSLSDSEGDETRYS